MPTEEVIAAIAEAQYFFVTITRKSTNDDLIRIKEIIAPILFWIPYDGVNNVHNMWGVIVPTDAYNRRYSADFVIPAHPPI